MRAFARCVPVAVCAAALILGPASLAGAHSFAVNTSGLSGLYVTTSGETLEAGTFVVGAGILFADEGDIGYTTYTVPVTLTYALSDGLEGGLSMPVITDLDPDGGPSESSVGDLLVSLKYSVQKETEGLPSIAVGGRVKIPTADDEEGLGSGEVDLGLFAALDKDLSGVRGYLNVEYFIVSEPDNGFPEQDQVNYAVGIGIPYKDNVDFGVELLDQSFLTSPWVPGFPGLQGDILLGSAYIDMPPSINLGLAVGFGLSEFASDFLVGGKISLRL